MHKNWKILIKNIFYSFCKHNVKILKFKNYINTLNFEQIWKMLEVGTFPFDCIGTMSM